MVQEMKAMEDMASEDGFWGSEVACENSCWGAEVALLVGRESFGWVRVGEADR